MPVTSTYSLTITNFASTDFPMTVTVMTPPGTIVFTATVYSNGTVDIDNGQPFPGRGHIAISANADGQGEIPFLAETVVLLKDEPAPEPIATTNRYIRVTVRNFPIDDKI